jgi:hypothetical protein
MDGESRDGESRGEVRSEQLFSPTRTLRVLGCSTCPFARPAAWDSRLPMCEAPSYLDGKSPRSLGGVAVVGGDFFPSAFPLWCPLRAGGVTVEVQYEGG